MNDILKTEDLLLFEVKAAVAQVNKDLKEIGNAYTNLFKEMYFDVDGELHVNDACQDAILEARKKYKEDVIIFRKAQAKLEKEKNNNDGRTEGSKA